MQSQYFLGNGANSQGQTAFSHPNLSYRTRQRLLSEVEMRQAAKNKNDLRNVANNILTNNLPMLAAYVQGNGEVPNQDQNKLILQAALIRLSEIENCAKAYDLSDENATLIVEDEESNAKTLNLPGNEILPDPQVLAALKLVYDTLKQQLKTDSVGAIQKITGANNFDNFQPSFGDIVDGIEDFGFNNEYYKDRDSGILPYNNWDSTRLKASNPDAVTINNLDNTGTTTTPTPSTGGGVFGFVDKIVNSISAVGGAVQNQADQTASQSISYAIKQNLPIILGLFVILGLVIFLSIHAAKNK